MFTVYQERQNIYANNANSPVFYTLNFWSGGMSRDHDYTYKGTRRPRDQLLWEKFMSF